MHIDLRRKHQMWKNIFIHFYLAMQSTHFINVISALYIFFLRNKHSSLTGIDLRRVLTPLAYLGARLMDKYYYYYYYSIYYYYYYYYYIIIIIIIIIIITVRYRGKSVRSWCDGSSDRSFMVDPLSYFSLRGM